MVGLLLAAAFAGSASAGVVLVTDRTTFAGTDFYDWTQLGSANTSIPNVGFPGAAVTSNGGLAARLSIPAGTLTRVDEGNGWLGNFAIGAPLLFSNNTSNSFIALNWLDIKFSSPVAGAGAQIGTYFRGAFQAQIDAFDSSGGLLQSSSFIGDSNSNGDNSAIFIGLLSDSINISKIRFQAYTKSGIGFAINQLDITNSPLVTVKAPTGVPEPGVLLLFGFGLLGVGGLRRRRTA